jgi:hypothetical protein
LFRGIALAAIMGALLFLYRVHPAVGWSTLATLAVGAVVVGSRRKAHAQ